MEVKMVRKPALLAAASLLAVILSGCVERRYTIRSDVPGTLVYVNGEEIGPVPASRTFYYYGDRDIVLQAPGYEIKRVLEPIKAPWYDNLLTEFFTENLWPFTIRDERNYAYHMEPITIPAADDVVARGQQYRTRAQTPPPPRRRGILGFLGF